MNSLAEYVRSVLLTCPYITASALDMHVDFLDDADNSYSIDAIPTPTVIKAYRFGGGRMRFSFALTATRDGLGDTDRAANVLHFEQLSEWMRKVSARHQLPAMDETRQPEQLSTTGAAYVSARDPDGTEATYQMQAELIYHQKGVL